MGRRMSLGIANGIGRDESRQEEAHAGEKLRHVPDFRF